MNRIDVINNLIKANDYKSYLEIGVQHGESFREVRCANKIGVDPDPRSRAPIVKTSDQFFFKELQENNAAETKPFDIVFIDGLHTYEQCKKDIFNALAVIPSYGSIVVHDLLPTTQLMQEVPRKKDARQWTGDVWRAWIHYRSNKLLKMEVYDFDFGVGVIQFGSQKPIRSDAMMDFSRWKKYRNDLMNVVNYNERKCR